MTKGFNKAEYDENRTWEQHAERSPSFRRRPCIFLSHKTEDKPSCILIARHLKEVGIDYYLDIDDSTLQTAVNANDATQITESIKKGIRNSTHMLCVISEKTYQSVWVPFEIGYGHAAIIDKTAFQNAEGKSLKLSILTLKDLSHASLPQYMHAAYTIRGIESLNKFISKVLGIEERQLILKRRLFHANIHHPLSNVLNPTK